MATSSPPDRASPERARIALPELAIFLFVFVVHLPFLFWGLGEDPDGWRIYSAASHLAETGIYVPSRPPGYPLPEYLDALLIKVGLHHPFWLNLPSALMAAVAAAALLRLLRPLGLTRAVLAALAFASTVAVFKAGNGPMDYLYGAGFLLVALNFAAGRRAIVGAIFLGLAAASRTTYALGIIPFLLAFWLNSERRDLKSVAPVAVAACAVSGAVAAAFYVPLVLTSGLSWLTFTDHDLDLVKTGANATVELFGILGVLAVAVGVVVAAIRTSREIKTWTDPRLRILLPLAATTLIYSLVYLRLPDAAGYLIPALFGLYGLIFMTAPTGLGITLVVALALSCAAGGLSRTYDGKAQLSLSGPVARELRTQRTWSCVADLAKEEMRKAPAGTFLVAGHVKPAVLAMWGQDPRVAYLVAPTADGRLETEGRILPPTAKYIVLDAVARFQAEKYPIEKLDARILNTAGPCGPHR